MTDRHTHKPFRFRPPEAERLWLAGYQERTGKPMNAILTEAVRALRAQAEQRIDIPASHDVTTGGNQS